MRGFDSFFARVESDFPDGQQDLAEGDDRQSQDDGIENDDRPDKNGI
jgi:hypothetical protein